MANQKNILNYHFKDPNLLDVALTHKSFSKENNERLEFLGDAILNFLIAELLFKKFGKSKEGSLTQFRSSLVRREVLNEIGKSLNLGKYIKLGHGEKTTNTSILGNTLEALVAAVFLDGGFKACSKFVESLYDHKLNSINPNIDIRDPKTKLQEHLQKKGSNLPFYELKNQSIDKESKKFEVTCILKEQNVSSQGWGKTIKKAESMAASKLLKKLSK